MNILVIGEKKLKTELQTMLTPFHTRIETVDAEEGMKRRLKIFRPVFSVFDDDYFSANPAKRSRLLKILRDSRGPFVLISSLRNPDVILDAKKQGASDYILRPYNTREFIMRFNAVIRRRKRIACASADAG